MGRIKDGVLGVTGEMGSDWEPSTRAMGLESEAIEEAASARVQAA